MNRLDYQVLVGLVDAKVADLRRELGAGPVGQVREARQKELAYLLDLRARLQGRIDGRQRLRVVPSSCSLDDGTPVT